MIISHLILLGQKTPVYYFNPFRCTETYFKAKHIVYLGDCSMYLNALLQLGLVLYRFMLFSKMSIFSLNFLSACPTVLFGKNL